MSRILLMSSGAIVWALHFTALYGFTALACARGFPAAVPWFAGIASAVAAAAMLAIVARNFGRREAFERWLAGAIAAFALVGIAYATVPVYVVRTCA